MITVPNWKARRVARWISETIPEQMAIYATACAATPHESAHRTAHRQCEVWGAELTALLGDAALLADVQAMLPAATTAAIQSIVASLAAIQAAIAPLLPGATSTSTGSDPLATLRSVLAANVS